MHVGTHIRSVHGDLPRGLSIRVPRDGSTGEEGRLFRGILGSVIPVC